MLLVVMLLMVELLSKGDIILQVSVIKCDGDTGRPMALFAKCLLLFRLMMLVWWLQQFGARLLYRGVCRPT